MIDRKQNMLKIILNAKENIMEFNENVQSKKKELPDIRRIKKELTQIEKINSWNERVYLI